MARKITLRDCDVDFFRRFYHVAYIVRIAHWYIEGRQNNVALKLHDAAAMAFDSWASAAEEIKRNRVAVARCLGN